MWLAGHTRRITPVGLLTKSTEIIINRLMMTVSII
jgi:hypothetical protein